jgi:hypothetical protein
MSPEAGFALAALNSTVTPSMGSLVPAFATTPSTTLELLTI